MRFKAVKWVMIVGVAGLIQVSDPSVSDALTGDVIRVTGLQTNGMDCVLRDPTTGFMWRNSDGMQNAGGSDVLMFCPIADASDDSYASNLLISFVEVHYMGAPAPTCNVVVRGTEGGVFMSPNLVAGTSATSGTPVVKLTAPWRTDARGLQAALGLKCVVPPQVTIVGSTAKREHHQIEGGV